MKNVIKNYISLMRLNNMAGVFLLFIPCLIGVFLASKHDIHLYQLYTNAILFFIGSLLMRTAGCVINDIIDRKIDAKVERTKNRPIAAGKISVKSALVLLSVLVILAFFTVIQFNIRVVAYAFLLLPFVVIYPTVKRFSNLPQYFLGAIYNSGCVLASVSFFEKIEYEFLLFYVALIIWTVVYDTLYAFQDTEDDLKSGVKSFAVKISKYKNPKLILSFLTVIMFSIILYVGMIMNVRSGYFIVMIIACMYQISLVKNCDLSSKPSCMNSFKKSIFVGLIMCFGIFAG